MVDVPLMPKKRMLLLASWNVPLLIFMVVGAAELAEVWRKPPAVPVLKLNKPPDWE
jgi:hypothetical protein